MVKNCQKAENKVKPLHALEGSAYTCAATWGQDIVSLAHNHYFWVQKLNHNVSFWEQKFIK